MFIIRSWQRPEPCQNIKMSGKTTAAIQFQVYFQVLDKKNSSFTIFLCHSQWSKILSDKEKTLEFNNVPCYPSPDFLIKNLLPFLLLLPSPPQVKHVIPQIEKVFPGWSASFKKTFFRREGKEGGGGISYVYKVYEIQLAPGKLSFIKRLPEFFKQNVWKNNPSTVPWSF